MKLSMMLSGPGGGGGRDQSSPDLGSRLRFFTYSLQLVVFGKKEIATNSSGLSVAMCKNLMDDAWNSTPEEAMLKESWSKEGPKSKGHDLALWT